MHEFFNPAGLEVLEDRLGAVAYGFIAPRVFYARFVGELTAELGGGYLVRLGQLAARVPSLAYFADASALSGYQLAAKTGFLRFVLDQRAKLTSIVVLTWSAGLTPAARDFAATVGEPMAILEDPGEFDRLLSNLLRRPRERVLSSSLELHPPGHAE